MRALAILLSVLTAATQSGQFTQRRQGAPAHALPLRVTGPLVSLLASTPALSSQCTGSLSGVTTSRASAKYCTKSDGSLVALSSNAPAVESAGLLSEGQSTNHTLQSQALATAPWSTLNGTSAAPTVTNNTSDVTDPTGGNAATKIVFPAVSAGGAYSLASQVISPSAGTYTQDIYLRGASSGTVYFDVSDGAVLYTAACTFTSSFWTRCSRATTSASPFTRFDVGVNLNDGPQSAQPAQTVYAWQAEFNDGALLGSPIASAGTTATRAGDVLSVTAPSALPGAWCASATVTPEGSWNLSARRVLMQFGGTYQAANSLTFSVNASNLISAEVYDGSGTGKTVTAAQAFSGTTSHALQVCDSAGTLAINFDGTAQTVTTTGTGTGVIGAPASPLYLGSLNGASFINGWMQNICVGAPNTCN
jgi:hypothetical protein